MKLIFLILFLTHANLLNSKRYNYDTNTYKLKLIALASRKNMSYKVIFIRDYIRSLLNNASRDCEICNDTNYQQLCC